MLETGKKLNLYIKSFLPSAIWAGLIFFLSDQGNLPSMNISTFDFIFKKSAHIFVYSVLYFLIFYGVQQVISKKYAPKAWYLPLIICICYAISDEVHQSIVPGRNATLRDISYDTLGASIVMLKKLNYI
jgi:VanZ family protein